MLVLPWSVARHLTVLLLQGRSLGLVGLAGAGAMIASHSQCSAAKHPLDALWDTIESRRAADPQKSWTAKLLSPQVCAKGRGGGDRGSTGTAITPSRLTPVYQVIEAVAGNKEGLVKESADLLYHLQVMWVAVGITPEDVYDELRRRDGVSGIAEKASRPK